MGNIENKPDAVAMEFIDKVQTLPYISKPQQPGPVVINLADVKSKPIDWIWHGVLARGKITILSSNPGCGKSTVTIDIAARLSEGKPWPVTGENAIVGSSIFLSAEDDPADTIRPRFDLAVGNPAKVKILNAIRDKQNESDEIRERALDLTRDLGHVEHTIDCIQDCALLVIDPINSYIGDADSHKDSAIRGAILAPLQNLASRKNIAVLLISHLRKSGGKAIHRTLGSIGFVGASRIAFGIVKDAENPERRLMVCQKSNISRDNLGFAFSLKESDGFAKIEWESDHVRQSADEVFDAEENRRNDDDEDILLDSIRDILAGGVSKSFVDIKAAIKEQVGHVGDAKLRKAIKGTGAINNRDGFGGAVTWRIPPGE